MKSNSWVIVSKATGKPVAETFQQSVANKVNLEKYQVYTAYDWLCYVNRTIKAADAKGVKSIFHT